MNTHTICIWARVYDTGALLDALKGERIDYGPRSWDGNGNSSKAQKEVSELLHLF